MAKIKKHGNYSIIQYDIDFFTIDFSNDSVGLTIQSFESLEQALYIFENTVKTLSEHKAKHHNNEVVKMIINSI